jgi:putative two-component system response regulator
MLPLVTSQPTIYVAEDTPEHRLLIETLLSTTHPEWTVRIFEDGLEAYLATLEAPPQLLILDIIMPGMSGLAAVRLLKLHELYRNIPILMVSSMIDADIQQRALRAGADGYMRKPYDPAELLEAVASRLKAAPAG